MPELDLDGQTLHYRDEGAGTPLVLLSANPGDSRDFDAVAPALAQHFRVLRVDWPGYGASPAPHPPEQAGAGYFLQAFGDLVERLGLGRFSIVGNSVGGNVAARYALEHPQRVERLVLVSPGGFTRHTPVTRLFCRLQGQPGFNRAIGPLFTRLYLNRRTDLTRQLIARSDTGQNTDAARRVNAAVWRSFLAPEHNLLERAKALRCPTLICSGRKDPVIPAGRDGKFAASVIPGARQVVFNCGHEPFAELPDEFLAVVQPFLLDSGDENAAR